MYLLCNTHRTNRTHTPAAHLHIHATGKSLNSMSTLSCTEAREFKRKRREGMLAKRGEFLASQLLSDRDHRQVERGWKKRTKRTNKITRKIASTARHLDTRVPQLEAHIDQTGVLIARLMSALCRDGIISTVFLPDEVTGGEFPVGGVATGGTAAAVDESETPSAEFQISNAQEEIRLKIQATSGKEALNMERDRDQLQLGYLKEAMVLVAGGSPEGAAERGVSGVCVFTVFIISGSVSPNAAHPSEHIIIIILLLPSSPSNPAAILTQ